MVSRKKSVVLPANTELQITPADVAPSLDIKLTHDEANPGNVVVNDKPVSPDAKSVTATTTTTTTLDIDNGDEPLIHDSFFWVRDARGNASVTVTLVAVAFWVTTFGYILSWFTKIGSIDLRPFDVGAAAVYLSPVLTLYGARKWTSAKYKTDAPPPPPSA